MPSEFRAEFQAWFDAENSGPLKDAVSPEFIAYLDALPDNPRSIRNPANLTGPIAEMDFAKAFYLPDPSLNLIDAPLDSPEGPVSIDSLQGGYTLLAFWATWCAPCLLELPHLAEIEQEFAEEGLKLIAVQSEKPASDLAAKTEQALAKAGAENLTHWRDGGPDHLAQWTATGRTLPMTVLIGPDGQEIGRQTGVIRAPGAPEDATQWSTPEAHDFFRALVSPQPAP
ncbi:MAG: TlpA disulfide reductase family protein [Maricaulaceae bacterium]